MKHTYLLIATLPNIFAPTKRTWNLPRKIFNANCTTSYVLNSGGRWTESHQISTGCTEMIADYSAEIKIVIYQSLSVRQHAKWATIVKFRPSRSTIFIFYPFLTQNYWTDFHHLFTWCRAISVAINAHIHKAMVHSVSECEIKEWRRSILTSAKSPQNQLVTIATSIGLSRNLCQFL